MMWRVPDPDQAICPAEQQVSPPCVQIKDEKGYTHMQVDGEPWRQPIPAAPDALRARRPSSLQQPRDSGGAAAPASRGQLQPQPVVLRVSHAGHSEMLFNDRDPQVSRGRGQVVGARYPKP